MKMTAHSIFATQQVVFVCVSLLLLHNVCGRHEQGTHNGIPQSLLQRIAVASYKEPLNNDLANFPQVRSNYLTKWPSLEKEVMSVPSEYEYDLTDNESRRLLMQSISAFEENASFEDNNNEKVLVPELIPTPSPLKENSPMFMKTKVKLKTQKVKKNLRFANKNYMSPCHFKICNMGRKRNVHLYNY